MKSPADIQRHLEALRSAVIRAHTSYRLVLIFGPSQTGKSVVAQQLALAGQLPEKLGELQNARHGHYFWDPIEGSPDEQINRFHAIPWRAEVTMVAQSLDLVHPAIISKVRILSSLHP